MRIASLLLCFLLVPHLAAAQAAAPAAEGSPRVRVVTTAGNFVIELDRTRAPLTVATFLKYVNQGFYTGVIFHRVVAGFIAQAGGYTADMEQKPVTDAVINESGNGLSNCAARLASRAATTRTPGRASSTSTLRTNRPEPATHALGLCGVRQGRRRDGSRRRHRASAHGRRRPVRSQRSRRADRHRAHRADSSSSRDGVVHLRPASACGRRGDARRFTEFIAGPARAARALYILGDLFEAWIGDDDDDPGVEPIVAALHGLTTAGVPCALMHGNRDFLLGRQFCEMTGCRLLGDYEGVTLVGSRSSSRTAICSVPTIPVT